MSSNAKLKKENLKLYKVTSDSGYERIWRRSALVYFCKSVYKISFYDFKVKYKGYYNGYKLTQVPNPEHFGEK